MTLRITLFLLCCSIGAMAAQDKDPNLGITLAFMQNTLSNYGYLHTTGADQQLKIQQDEPCRLYVEWETKFLSQHRIFPTEYQMHLATIDPDSVTVVTDANQKAKPGWKAIRVHIAATDAGQTIFMSASNWKEDKNVPSILQMASFDFLFRDKEQAEKFARALKHAIILCGGKPSSF